MRLVNGGTRPAGVHRAHERASEVLEMDAATLRNLEIVQTLSGTTEPTLLSLLDRCETAAGSRLLRARLSEPPRDPALSPRPGTPQSRRWPATSRCLFHRVQDVLRGLSDIERIASRIAMASVRPRELAGLRATLATLPALGDTWRPPTTRCCCSPRCACRRTRLACPARARAIADEPALAVRDGGVIASGYDTDLTSCGQSSTTVAPFSLPWSCANAKRTGILNLRVEYNKVSGFTSRSRKATWRRCRSKYKRRQTLKNVERYITPELKTFEDKALAANDRALAAEKRLFEELLQNWPRHSTASARPVRRLRNWMFWPISRSVPRRCRCRDRCSPAALP